MKGQRILELRSIETERAETMGLSFVHNDFDVEDDYQWKSEESEMYREIS
jgi:hypothetical protein